MAADPYLGFGVAAALAGYWLFLIWRVRVEKGWVGIAPLRIVLLGLVGRLTLLADQIATTLLPSIAEANAARRRIADALAKRAT